MSKKCFKLKNNCTKLYSLCPFHTYRKPIRDIVPSSRPDAAPDRSSYQTSWSALSRLPPCYLQHVLPTQKITQPRTHCSTSCLVSCRSRTFLGGAMSPSLLHIVLPHGPPRWSSPSTAPLFGMIHSPMFMSLCHHHQGGWCVRRPWCLPSVHFCSTPERRYLRRDWYLLYMFNTYPSICRH